MLVTSTLIDGWVTPWIMARSVSRRGPVRSSVDSVDAAVRLISLGPLRTARMTSPYSASPMASRTSCLLTGSLGTASRSAASRSGI
jgi:hypothetical protein